MLKQDRQSPRSIVRVLSRSAMALPHRKGRSWASWMSDCQSVGPWFEPRSGSQNFNTNQALGGEPAGCFFFARVICRLGIRRYRVMQGRPLPLRPSHPVGHPC